MDKDTRKNEETNLNQQTPPPLEGFVPTDYYSSETRTKSKKKKTLVVLVCIFLVLIAIVAVAYFYFRHMQKQAAVSFQVTPTPSPALTASPAPDESGKSAVRPDIEATPEPVPFASVSERMPGYAGSPDLSQMDNIVNIALIGVDYAEERDSWKGKDGISAAHADVIIILAVNFDKNTATMISLPRDTYTYVPGVSGIYKLNGSLNCGGGLSAPDGAGFNKVMETASYLLGGIPVNYYYAVTMPAVKKLVDAIGGVRYHLDVSFTMQGRSYYAGWRQMDGQAVLDYLRVRKEASGLEPGQTGDAHRVVRQKKMLLAIFNQLKKADNLLKIPEIIDSFRDGGLYTNCTFEQTSNLVAYAATMPSDNISMCSMTGTGGTIYTWNFSFVKQDNRRKIIRNTYGIEVPEIFEITEKAAEREYQSRIANQYISTCAPMTRYIETLLEEDSKLPETSEDPSVQTRKYSAANRRTFDKYLEQLDACKKIRGNGTAGQIKNAAKTFKKHALQCARLFDYPGNLTWTTPVLADANGVYVDFR